MEELPPIQLEEPIEMTPLESNVLLAGGAVTSVNGKTGAVILTASDVGAASTSALSSEVAARAQADNSIRASITTETNARQSADNSLRTSINNEVTARTNADATLQNKITAEANARTQADTNLQNNINNKVDKVAGKGLSTNDFTNALKTKLDNIQAGAEVNVQANYAQTDTTAEDYIKNKPTLATVATTGAYSDLTGTPTLATVATSGDYDDLINKPTPYTIPTASASTLGGVKVGANLSIDANGVLSASGGTSVDFATDAEVLEILTEEESE